MINKNRASTKTGEQPVSKLARQEEIKKAKQADKASGQASDDLF